MKIFILGAPASGKTTIASKIREVSDVRAIDADDEIIALNNGVWPDIETKNNTLLPRVVEEAINADAVVLFNSYMPAAELDRLKTAGFKIMLLEVSEKELERRHIERQTTTEGWRNEEWFEWHQAIIKELRKKKYIDEVISGEQLTQEIVKLILSSESS